MNSAPNRAEYPRRAKCDGQSSAPPVPRRSTCDPRLPSRLPEIGRPRACIEAALAAPVAVDTARGRRHGHRDEGGWWRTRVDNGWRERSTHTRDRDDFGRGRRSAIRHPRSRWHCRPPRYVCGTTAIDDACPVHRPLHDRCRGPAITVDLRRCHSHDRYGHGRYGHHHLLRWHDRHRRIDIGRQRHRTAIHGLVRGQWRRQGHIESRYVLGERTSRHETRHNGNGPQRLSHVTSS